MRYLVILTVIFMVLGLFLPESSSAQNLEIWFIWANGHTGTATLIRGPNGTVVLYDELGGGSAVDYLYQLLNDIEISHIDYAIAGHYDTDHCGGLDDLSSSLGGDSHFGTYYDRGGSRRSDGSELPSDYYKIVNGNPKRMTPTLGPTGAIDLGDGATLTFLSMGAPDNPDLIQNVIYVHGHPNLTADITENQKSITALLTYRGFDLYIGSDAEGEVEGVIKDVIVDDLDRQPDICLVDHHGSATHGISSASFCAKMDPEVAVISVWNNPHEHPRRATVTNFHNVVEQLPQRILRLDPGDDTPPNADWAPEDMYSECYTTDRHIYVYTNGLTYTVDTVDRSGGNDITEPGLSDHVTDEPGSPIMSPTPTPYGFETPSPTPAPETGPISGRVYDRETGEGVYNLYVRALPTESGLTSGGARTDSGGNYTVTKSDGSGLAAGLYYMYVMYVDSSEGSGVNTYRSQYYNQKDTQSNAVGVASNSTGIEFPLYKKGIYPTPTMTPPLDFQAIRVANGDYSGDGLSDIAIFRDSSGLWAVRAVTRLYFGTGGDVPVSGDYDGDGTADIALFRNSSGLWAIRDISRLYFGATYDLPVPGDYDGDGSCDIGIFRDSSGLWAVKDLTRNYFGSTSDQPVAGDYDGDGRDDFAIFRKSSGLWALKDISRIYHGSSSDTPVSGDYNGTGTAAPAIYRSSSGLWSIRNISRVYFGGAADQPVSAGFSGADDISIFRQFSGLWAIRGVTRVYFGMSNDIPITR